jgi:REP element-mobilizing transposase RayT
MINHQQFLSIMKYNPNFHHRRSIRLQGYDYSQKGLYFITICSKNREHFFGRIVKDKSDQKMILSSSGQVVENCWFEIPAHFPNVKLYEFIVMPNHIHGIIEIIAQSTAPISTKEKLSVTLFRSPSMTIGSVLRSFKIGVTKWHRSNTDIWDVWQRSFHDHIIRDEKAYFNISNYIKNNPNSWNEDTFYNR